MGQNHVVLDQGLEQELLYEDEEEKGGLVIPVDLVDPDEGVVDESGLDYFELVDGEHSVGEVGEVGLDPLFDVGGEGFVGAPDSFGDGVDIGDGEFLSEEEKED